MGKPSQPYADFPLFAHANGQWAKKIRGRLYYFGVWDDPFAAREKFDKQRDYLYAGQAPPTECETLGDVLDAFKADKQRALDEGDINSRTFGEYEAMVETIGKLGRYRSINGIGKDDLTRLRGLLSKGKKGQQVSPVTLKRLLTFARMVFKYANDEHDANIKYSKPLASPAKKQIRERKNQAAKKLFTAEQIRTLRDAASPHIKAMILLGINAGFGPTDCVSLLPSDIRDGFYDSYRVKTQVPRRCPLWKETQKAVAAIAGSQLVFNGRQWDRHVFAREFKALCETCGIYQKGVTEPYTLRRTFETIAKTAPVNQSVIDKIMGHERPDMSEVYNQTVFDQELRKCVDHVHKWLTGSLTLS
ncbi:tyrosine-type recombinase/integrase [Botrimarina mediterranea]|uniref:Phage integrase family protein n=1 Tax=Botrimarina mediterranea TaxID=2528022 RepID=A0A518K5J5_9BACT|nr:tyrosine-type recombinase/integrase [Botrimarina mediterranea]QDV73056.1 Phage integrase family protein [Botrimarina mediterranea]